MLGLGLVFGVSNPSMNNAGFDIAPDRIATIAGLRMMAQQLGSRRPVAEHECDAAGVQQCIAESVAAVEFLGGDEDQVDIAKQLLL